MVQKANPIKVMTMHYTLRRGGAYDRFRMMLDALLERQCEIHCLSLDPVPLDHPLYHNHVLAMPSAFKKGFAAKLLTLVLFPGFGLWVGWREGVDRCVAFGPLYALLQAATKRILGKPVITFIRVSLASGPGKKKEPGIVTALNRLVEKTGLRSSSRVIVVNTSLRDETRRVLGARKTPEVEILFNHIPSGEASSPRGFGDVRKEYRVPPEARLIVSAGVLTPRKNFEGLIRSFSRLRREDLFLLIAGDGGNDGHRGPRDDLQRLIERCDLGKRVVLTGWLERKVLWEIYDAADLMVFPSLEEGMPNALLEALGRGLPCLGSSIPGIRDVLHHELLMFDPSDEAALAQKVERFFSDASFSGEVARLCLERKKEFLFDWKERVFQLITREMGVSN